MTPTKPAIHLDHATVRFPGQSLVFDATIPAGGIIAVVGASGSGKSTLLNLVAGFETPDAGRIAILGRDTAGMAPAARPLSVIFQDHNLFAHLDVTTNIGLGIDPALRLTADDRARMAEALAAVGLDGFGRRMPPTLSGGERQRVALARALVRRRPILLLDEPFAALDPGLRAEMAALVAGLHRREANTVLLVTHHPDDVLTLADTVLFLDGGRILLHEPAGTFLARNEPAPVARFLGRQPPPATSATI